MRQLWPLNRASLETGPFYPFDNGPNGVNTLVAPQWLTRYVLDSMKLCRLLCSTLLHCLLQMLPPRQTMSTSDRLHTC